MWSWQVIHIASKIHFGNTYVYVCVRTWEWYDPCPIRFVWLINIDIEVYSGHVRGEGYKKKNKQKKNTSRHEKNRQTRRYQLVNDIGVVWRCTSVHTCENNSEIHNGQLRCTCNRRMVHFNFLLCTNEYNRKWEIAQQIHIYNYDKMQTICI